MCVCVCKQNLALNSLQGSIFHKTPAFVILKVQIFSNEENEVDISNPPPKKKSLSPQKKNA